MPDQGTNINASTDPGKPFYIDKKTTSSALCNLCAEDWSTNGIRIAKHVPNQNGDKKKLWYHVTCIFDEFLQQNEWRRILNPNDIEGWEGMNTCDKKEVEKIIEITKEKIAEKVGTKRITKEEQRADQTARQANINLFGKPKTEVQMEGRILLNTHISYEKDGWLLFRPICNLITKLEKCTTKSQRILAISEAMYGYGLFTKHILSEMKMFVRLVIWHFKGAMYSRIPISEIVTIFKEIFGVEEIVGTTEIEIATTIAEMFANSTGIRPVKISTLLWKDVFELYKKCTGLISEDTQVHLFKLIMIECTPDELKMIIRLFTTRLDLNLKVRHLMHAIHPECAAEFKTNERELHYICNDKMPLLAEPVRKYLFTTWPLKPFREIVLRTHKTFATVYHKLNEKIFCGLRYRGSTLHIHRQNEEIRYYASGYRQNFHSEYFDLKEFLFATFPFANNLIAICQLILYDAKTNMFENFLEKGSTYGARLLIDDCMFIDEDITGKPFRLRRKYLAERTTLIDDKNMFGMKEIRLLDDINPIIEELLENPNTSLVIKGAEDPAVFDNRVWYEIPSTYFYNRPIHADFYLEVFVGGAWIDKDEEGAIVKTTFLMFVYDPVRDVSLACVKLPIREMKLLDVEATMKRINCKLEEVPSWLVIGSPLNVPQYICTSPLPDSLNPVWSVKGYEIIYDKRLEAKITLFYPRFVRQLLKRTWKDTTTPEGLRELYKNSPFQAQEYSERLRKQEEANLEKIYDMEKMIANGELSPSALDPPDPPSPLKPIPQYFAGVKLFLDEEMKGKHTRWITHFAEAGGTVVDNQDAATHIMHFNDTESQESRSRWKPEVKHVFIEWVKHTILKGVLQDEKPYTVRVIN
ncbi:lig3 [Trypoxylus dichotomus]